MFPLSSQAARPEVSPRWRNDHIVWGMCIRRTMSYLAIEASATDSTPASDSTPAPNVAPKARRWRAEGAPSMAMSAEGANARRCAASEVDKPWANARSELSTDKIK